jgi:hypothetical protein
MSQTKDEIKQKFLKVLPHFRYAIKQAKEKAGEQGSVQLCVAAMTKTSGQMLAQFEACEFIEDIAKLIDAPDYTEEDELEAKAEELCFKFGLRK